MAVVFYMLGEFASSYQETNMLKQLVEFNYEDISMELESRLFQGFYLLHTPETQLRGFSVIESTLRQISEEEEPAGFVKICLSCAIFLF